MAGFTLFKNRCLGQPLPHKRKGAPGNELILCRVYNVQGHCKVRQCLSRLRHQAKQSKRIRNQHRRVPKRNPLYAAQFPCSTNARIFLRAGGKNRMDADPQPIGRCPQIQWERQRQDACNPFRLLCRRVDSQQTAHRMPNQEQLLMLRAQDGKLCFHMRQLRAAARAHEFPHAASMPGQCNQPALRTGCTGNLNELGKLRGASHEAVDEHSAHIPATSPLLLLFCHRIKFVTAPCSRSGASTPCARPASMHFISHAMFLPRLRRICRPSKSCMTSSGVCPNTTFQ